MLVIPPTIADLQPSTAVLPQDLAVCALADDVAVEAEALRLRGDLPDRPTNSIKFAARAFRLFLTLSQRAEPVPRAFACDVLAAALGLDAPLRRTKARMVVAGAVGSARRDGRRLELSTVRGVKVRRAFDFLAEAPVAALATAVEADADALHSLAHPVVDPERLAGQIVAHIRAEGYVDDDARTAAWQVVDVVMLSQGRVSELMVIALAFALGVIQTDGDVSPRHLAALLGTRSLKLYRDAALVDGESRRRTGRWSPEQNIDKSIGRWRYLAPYRRLAD